MTSHNFDNSNKQLTVECQSPGFSGKVRKLAEAEFENLALQFVAIVLIENEALWVHLQGMLY